MMIRWKNDDLGREMDVQHVGSSRRQPKLFGYVLVLAAMQIFREYACGLRLSGGIDGALP